MLIILIICFILPQVSGFSTGGVVKILANEKALKLLQEGHGGYNADVGKVHNYGPVPEQGCQGQGKKKIQVREKSGNFLFNQGSCRKMKEVLKKSGNFKNSKKKLRDKRLLKILFSKTCK